MATTVRASRSANSAGAAANRRKQVEGSDQDLKHLAKALAATRSENSAPPQYEDVQRNPEFWADVLGFWR